MVISNNKTISFLTENQQRQVTFTVPTLWAEIIIFLKFGNIELNDFMGSYTFQDAWIIYLDAVKAKVILNQYDNYIASKSLAAV